MEFAQKHPKADAPLKSWVKVLESNSFKHFPDLCRSFSGVDYFKSVVVFNIGGNKYRVIAKIDYGMQTVLIKWILTHEEYDEEKWKKELI